MHIYAFYTPIVEHIIFQFASVCDVREHGSARLCAGVSVFDARAGFCFSILNQRWIGVRGSVRAARLCVLALCVYNKSYSIL